jgi:hypothetical protein
MENILLDNKHILLCVGFTTENLSGSEQLSNEFAYIKNNFCGIVITELNLNEFIDKFVDKFDENNSIIYICGDVGFNYNLVKSVQNTKYVISQLSWNYHLDFQLYEYIGLGQVPINVHNMGVYFKNFFDTTNTNTKTNTDTDTNTNTNTNTNKPGYFELVNSEHQFQSLTESNKPSNAYRTGLYITQVNKLETIDKPAYSFHLLRCSSNFSGPTENLRPTDISIINTVNQTAKNFFQSETNLNHVLAQIYHNTKEDTNLEHKAKIKAHSDKTKDMPANGLMAFCTFYKDFSSINQIKKSNLDYFDYCYKESNTSIFTKLRFRLKSCVSNSELTKQFDILLYPNSVFLMGLQTNRLYTHEIIPSSLPVEFIPIRMGYVIRCSKTLAIHNSLGTFIQESGNLVKLKELDDSNDLDDSNTQTLKQLYFKENFTDELVEYPRLYFSLNNGDYLQPVI